MMAQGWRDAVINAVRDHDRGDEYFLELLVKVLVQQDEAKQMLRDKGYGCTGMDLVRTVKEVPRTEY